MGKYRKDYTADSDSEESGLHNGVPRFREWTTDYERSFGNKKKRKSKQFRQARKKRSLG